MPRRSNPNLKKSNQEVEFTHNQIRELKKCAMDPIYFISNYIYIQHPTKGLVIFEPYEYQKQLMSYYNEKRYNIVLSPRQSGKCHTFDTNVAVAVLPSGIKKFLLSLLDKSLYNKFFP